MSQFEWRQIHWLRELSTFIEQGNFALWGILFVSLVIFTLFFERILYSTCIFPRLIHHWRQDWNQQKHINHWLSLKLREAFIAQGQINLNQFQWFIQTAIVVCPFLGLMGTVSGMILVFDELAYSGTGNPRLMSSGIFQATIPTMAGMLVAIIGLIMQSILKRMNSSCKQRLADSLDPGFEDPNSGELT